ncbi:sulfur carrier protein ThiS [Gordonia sp. X0973]|uniref:sulfur carrier protein ThiS n=1 Tax=Gordonia sp. X0973 TaxID=2742602 RepID=UPI000F54323E|nr:sulfur carrier protein ThiS [Gordonia sp. X0973]QKT08998.1 sulfur carrier protein ThiS [Gordonia sp. X0973]
MAVTVNGDERTLPAGTTVTGLVTELGLPDRGIAVAVDGFVVPCGSWAQTELRPDDVVEIVTAVQGG